MAGRKKAQKSTEGQETASFSVKNPESTPDESEKNKGGRPKGSLGLKARTLLEVKNRIAEKADDLLNAELIEGLGSNIILKFDPQTKKYAQVSDPDEIIKVINEHRGASGEVDGQFYIVTAQQGNYKSRHYLFDRAWGRPSQTVEVSDAQDPDLLRLKSAIESRAKDKGIEYAEELKNFVSNYASTVRPEVKEKLVSELVQ